MAGGNPIPTNPRFEDLRGLRFGRLVVRDYIEIRNKHPFWRCDCDCGGENVVRSNTLKRGLTLSCKCYQAERRSESHRIHGDSHYRDGIHKETPEYAAWQKIQSRCEREADKSYQRYGGRGIAVCARWKDGEGGKTGYECFLADMGRRPSAQHSIDRKDNEGNYEPWNCRWATSSEQNRNRRDTVRVTFLGETLALADACDRAGANYHRTRGRMQRGWSFQRAISEPKHWRGMA